ncbi:DUF998 domain-containing protein [Spiractinospora alimapuensis]|uniref:DUF998 domain-containing protein n=1 Tax=Spiractinospora alimapuensis TaxID=2820884 RepID=UPI001F1C7629|nr:DUF998 domain-containing protein [Spiractinospora alimapuensis]QVQ51534.1 DUF998 domain-containing protein [Spiractinospora alimapuensis]
MSILDFALMAVVLAGLLVLGWWAGARRELGLKLGATLWAAIPLYHALEFAVLRATGGSHDPLRQPISDLAVTICGPETYPLSTDYICSPWHMQMNWGFVVLGGLLAAGALSLRRVWPRRRSATVTTVALVVFGLSWAASGLFPADVAFTTHTLLSLPGMFAPTVALLALWVALRGKRRGMATWSLTAGITAVVTLVLMTTAILWGIPPGGLAQRLLYAVPHVALTGIGLGLLLRGGRHA